MCSNEVLSSKEKLYNSAKTLFLKKGYKKTTVRDISELSGENMGLIVYYFGSKSQLAKEIYIELSDILYKEVDSILEKNSNSLETMFSRMLLFQALTIKDTNTQNFFEEVVVENLFYEASEDTIKMHEDIIKEYNIKITKKEAQQSQLIAKAVQRVFIEQKLNQTLQISYIELFKTVFFSSFLPIGISLETLKKAFEASEKLIGEENIKILNR